MRKFAMFLEQSRRPAVWIAAALFDVLCWVLLIRWLT